MRSHPGQERERERALADFPSLYRRDAGGPASLVIRGGEIELFELNRAAFGGVAEPCWEAMRPVELPGEEER